MVSKLQLEKPCAWQGFRGGVKETQQRSLRPALRGAIRLGGFWILNFTPLIQTTSGKQPELY